MTKQFFESVVQIPTVSGKEDMVRDFVKRWASRHGCRYRQDSAGNVYLSKGSGKYKPVLACHIDTVHSDQVDLIRRNEMKQLEWSGDVVTAKHPVTGKQTGLGADDLCGVAVTLSVLGRLKTGKAVLTAREELGCVGAKSVDAAFFEDASCVIGTDSPESNRATRYSDGVLLCGDEFFKKFVEPVCGKYGVTSFRREPLCDCAVYRKIDLGGGKRIECFNVGTGGYDPHKETEYAKFSEVQNAENLVYDLCVATGTGTRWTSGYVEDVGNRWRPYSLYRGGENLFSKADADIRPESPFMPSKHDMAFKWKFRKGFYAALLYARTVSRLMPNAILCTEIGDGLMRVRGRVAALKDAFRIAYNYDNGTQYRDWNQFAAQVEDAESRFANAIFDASRLDEPSEKPGSAFCSIELEFRSGSELDEFKDYLLYMKYRVEVYDITDFEAEVSGRQDEVKQAFAAWASIDADLSWRSWDEITKSIPKYRKLFFDSVRFEDSDEDDAIDVDFREVDEAGKWLELYESGMPLP